MLNSLLQIIGLVDKPIKKQGVLKTLDHTWTAIGEDLLPTLNNIVSNKDIKHINSNKYLKGALQTCDIKSSSIIDGIAVLKDFFTEVYSNYKNLKDTIVKYLSEYVSDTSITARDAAILRILTDTYGMCSYCLDLLYYTCIVNNETDLPKKKLEDIKSGIGSFSVLFKRYNKEYSKLIKEIKTASTHIIVDKQRQSLIGVLLNQTGKELKLPTEDGFINNPVYHIRMWCVDREIRKYESLKLRKQMLELKLMELKAKQYNENTERISKQISYYEEKLANVEYDISKIENN